VAAQAGENEKTIAISSTWRLSRTRKATRPCGRPTRVLSTPVTLQDTSKEKGVDLNWPAQYANGGPTEDYDFKIDETNPWIKITDDKGRRPRPRRRTDRLPGDAQLLRLGRLDAPQGGRRAFRPTHCGGACPEPPRPGGARRAKDDNLNHIADAWEDCYDLASKDAAADDENVPVGDGTNGDNAGALRRVPRLHIGKDNHHERLSPVYKDLFIVDYDQLGAGIYQKSTGVHGSPGSRPAADCHFPTSNAAAPPGGQLRHGQWSLRTGLRHRLRNTHIGTWAVGLQSRGWACRRRFRWFRSMPR